ncbi:MAG: GDP-mannose 4,6-dehydratase [Nanoarchaeota archaeon]|nr:GDP-mannose 4,6-dehydratase [Nanoarchaeota archaeon]
MRKALITGITGQDGSYLSEFLLEKGYEVWGMHRRSSVDGYFGRISHLKGRVKLVCGDLLDMCSLQKVVEEVKPDEVYNLAAQSQVRHSFDQPHLTNEINWLGVERLLSVIKEIVPNSRFYQASTSEMFGDVVEIPQNEQTPFNPVSPYAESKVKAHEAVRRERGRGLFACNGILFNHESPRRGLEFVTRKFTDGISRVKLGLPQRETGNDYIEIGNLESKRDWGFARDYVEAMWLMLQQERPDDYVIATGETHTIRKFLEQAAGVLDIQINWEGENEDEVGYDQNNRKIIFIDKRLFRPVEVNSLIGDSSKARRVLRWKPEVNFTELVKMMVLADYERLRKMEE